MTGDSILVKGARQHNLKNIDVAIPRNALTVITGLSGSGKSSLAFDTIFAEGQRRYIESLTNYARQFFSSIEKPEVESVDGLSPTISIDQKTVSFSPRSTVGTVTEIYDYLRLLFAKIAIAYCHQCDKPITSQTAQQIVDRILDFPENSKINLLGPIVRERKGEYQKELFNLRSRGFARVRIDGEVLDLAGDIFLDKQKKHSIDVYVDRLVLRTDPKASSLKTSISLRARLQESVENALKLGEGLIRVELQEPASDKTSELLFSDKHSCADCGISYPAPEPRTFSFNSPMGACKTCSGLGFLKPKEEDESETLSIHKTCPDCNGKRLKAESLSFKIQKQNIAYLSDLGVGDLLSFFESAQFNKRELEIAERIIKEIKDRLKFLREVGVDYLTLSRLAMTLSGGESQRIRLATQIGSSLVGVTYVLDEPSIGLHQRDNDKLIKTLKSLRDAGNTVIVVEHDKDTIESADFILDMGPGAGRLGGEIIAQGAMSDILKNKKSITSQYLNGTKKIAVPTNRRHVESKNFIELKGLNKNNLKNVTAKFPVGVFTCITGVSGSGKSTLIIDTLLPILEYKCLKNPKSYDQIPGTEDVTCTGLEHIDKVINIDQSPIGRTPRSNPATYTKLFDLIRDLFSQLPESRMRGFKPGHFSFNVAGGRCETCLGGGEVLVEMHFLPNSYVTCSQCLGKRYNPDVLEIKYKGLSISEVLSLTIDDAVEFFKNIHTLTSKLKILADVGLGYITLGQGSTSFSGGEAQRIKLSRELSKRATGKTLYILDEPSTGLHFDDIRRLIDILQLLVDQGNTVLVIEHNMEIIKTADHVIDLGPEAGAQGGEIIAEGTPEEVAKNKRSYTGKYLKDYLK